MLLCLNMMATVGILIMMMRPDGDSSTRSRSRRRGRSTSPRERDGSGLSRSSALRNRRPSPRTPQDASPSYDPYPPGAEDNWPQPPKTLPAGKAPTKSMPRSHSSSHFTPGDDSEDRVELPKEPTASEGVELQDHDLQQGQVHSNRPVAWLLLGPAPLTTISGQHALRNRVLQKIASDGGPSEKYLPDLLRWCFVKSNRSKATKVHQVFCSSAKTLPQESAQYFHKCCECWDLTKRPSATARAFAYKNTIHCDRVCLIYTRDVAHVGGGGEIMIVDLCRVCCPV